METLCSTSSRLVAYTPRKIRAHKNDNYLCTLLTSQSRSWSHARCKGLQIRKQTLGLYERGNSNPNRVSGYSISEASQKASASDGREASNSYTSTSDCQAKPELPSGSLPIRAPSTLLLGTGSYFLTAGLALALESSPELLLQEQLKSADMQAILAESASIGDLNFIPDIHLSPLGTLSFLLQNPLITLAVAAAAYYIIPRAFRALVRWLVLPVLLALVAYVIFENPSAALGLAKGLYSCECA